MHKVTARLAIVIALGGVLAGCGGDDIADQLAENAVEAAADEDVDVDLDTDSGELTVETDEGSVEVGGGGLPDEFAAVPLPEGFEIVGGAAVEQDGQKRYTGTGQLPGDNESALDELVSFYEDQGSDVTVDPDLNRVTAIVDDGRLAVQLVVVPNMNVDEGKTVVQVHIGTPA